MDAAPRGGSPGTLYVLELETGSPPDSADTNLLIEAHALDPAKVLRLAKAMGAQVGRLLLVGGEPGVCGEPEEMQLGLSAPMRAAVDEAIPLIESLVGQILRDQGEAATTVASAR